MIDNVRYIAQIYYILISIDKLGDQYTPEEQKLIALSK